MAYVINTGAICSVAYKGKMHGQDVMNTFHYTYTGPVLADGREFLVNAVGASAAAVAMYGAYVAAISEDVTDIKIYAQWIWPLRYRQAIISPAQATGQAGIQPSPNVAQVVTLFSELANRSGIANKHLPGVPQDMITAGALQPAQKTLLSDFGEEAIRVYLSGTGALVPLIFHRADPTLSQIAVGWLVNPYVRTERRRTVGAGK